MMSNEESASEEHVSIVQLHLSYVVALIQGDLIFFKFPLEGLQRENEPYKTESGEKVCPLIFQSLLPAERCFRR